MCAFSLEIGVNKHSDLSLSALTGVQAAIICPLRNDGSIHAEDLTRHVQSLGKDKGVNGLLVNGHAGEGHLFTLEEKHQIIRLARKAAEPEVFITAGITAEGTVLACEEAVSAAEAGAGAVLVFQPNHWFRGVDDDVVVHHHQSIADACGLPVVLYRAPLGWGELSYQPHLINRLIELEAVAGIKEGSWDVAAYEEIWKLVKEHRPDVCVMASGDEHLRACFQVGTDGSQVSLAALIPDTISNLYMAVKNDDWATANALHDQIYPLAVAVYRQSPTYLATARLKAGLKLLGRIETDTVRHPMRQLKPAEIGELSRVLKGI